MSNFSRHQQSVIDDCRNGNQIEALLEIIDELEDQITDWKDAANEARCSTPRELELYIKEHDSSDE